MSYTLEQKYDRALHLLGSMEVVLELVASGKLPPEEDIALEVSYKALDERVEESLGHDAVTPWGQPWRGGTYA